MYKSLKKIFIIFVSSLFLFFYQTVIAQSNYQISIANGEKINSTTYEFDVFIRSTDILFKLSSYQCALTFNPYFSNGGSLNLDTNKINSEGGLTARDARDMDMQPNLLEPMDLPGFKVETAANTGSDPMTNAHMRNWMECVRDRKKPNADITAGYNHSIATIMCTAALRTGEKASFDEAKQEVLAGGKVFRY